MMDKMFTPEMVTPQWVAVLLLAAILLLFGPRKCVLPTVLIVTAFMALQNRVYIFGLNFFTSRILLALAWVRILVRGEYRGFELRPMDKAWICFCLWCVVGETLQRGFPGTIYAVANHVYDGLGTYFLVRFFLRDLETFWLILKTLSVICCLLAGFMLAEFITHHNWLDVFGSIVSDVQVRDGRLRCQATFLHPVLAGTYGAVLLPIFAACWWQPRMKKLAIASCLACTVMVVTAGSGGPIMSYAAVVFAFGLWPFRRKLRILRWGTLIVLVALQLVMNAPVWALIGRVNIVQGNSAYHRFELIDLFIRNFSQWWLIGIPNTADWGWLSDDVANYFCIVAKHAGLLGLVLFVLVLVNGFRQVGLRRQEAETDRPTELLIWAFGVSLFGHVVSFFGTSYFDQTIVLWHFTLATVASLSLLTDWAARALETETVDAAALETEAPTETAQPDAEIPHTAPGIP